MANALAAHAAYRLKVCLLCYKKGNRPISDSEVLFIKTNLIKDYDRNNLDFPGSLCETCHINIKAKKSFYNLNMPENYDPQRPKILRDSDMCPCRICTVAKCNIFPKKKKNKRGCPKRQTTLIICAKCFADLDTIDQAHSCRDEKNKRAKVDNVQQLLFNTPTTSQRVASRIIKDSKTPNTSTPVLATLGPNPRRIFSSPNESGQGCLISADQMEDLQVDLSLTNNQTLLAAEHIRVATGKRKAIEPGFQSKMRVKNRRLSDYFESKKCVFRYVSKKEKIDYNFEEHVVVCKDINELMDLIIEERKLKDDEILVRIGMDGGGGFMKFVVSIFELNAAGGSKKRGEKIFDRFKHSGVKKLIILGTAPEIQENYVNIKRLWLETGIDNLARKFTIATDLKLTNIILGLMSHSSRHPCAWCDVTQERLEHCGVSRTIGSLLELFFQFFDSGAREEDAKKYGNAIHPPMFASGNIDHSTLVLLLIPPPELHLMLGPVNTLYDELDKQWGECEKWSSRLHIKREQYHGGQFNGNDSRKLLQNIDKLEEICPPQYEKFISTLKAFNDVVTSCYGRNLSSDFESTICKFRIEYKKLRINVTPKVHAVFHHVPEFCKLTKMGLAPWSEQAAESSHSEFTKIWERYKIKDTKHKKYSENLLDAVVVFNSLHM